MLNYQFDDYFELDKVKRQMRVDHNYDDEDIKDKCVIALYTVAGYLNRNIYPDSTTLPVPGDDTGINWIANIRGACYLVATDLYENRTLEATSSVTSRAFQLMLNPFRIFAIGAVD